MLIDGHAHLDMKDFEKDLEEVLARALEGGITHIITVGTDIASSVKAMELADRYDFISSTIGFHPHDAKDADSHALKELSLLAGKPGVVAWGEIGLDFYRRHSPPEKQIAAFEQQLDMADHFGLPAVIHSRDADKEMLEILGKRGRHKGVIHCFSGDFSLAMQYIAMGYSISIPGIVTYKNAFQVQDVASRVPLESLLIETDAPYLAPVPKRGKRNEPLFVAYTAAKVSQLRNIPVEELGAQISQNTRRLFGLPQQDAAPKGQQHASSQ